ncbi:protein arginine N-methyltransferase 6 [Agrilus planipennis]|nr:protein arginine N-methyltransferase 6 [Agrilus planipennis]
MGHYLLHEGMLDSVIYARDNFLRREGLLFPENVTLFSSPCSIPSLNESWANVNGVSMKSFGKQLKEAAMKEPLLIQINPDDVLSEPESVLWLNLHDVTLEDLESINFRHVTSASKDGRYQGICLWFTCTFPYYSTEPVILSTGPDDPKTHWLQTVISLPVDVDVEKGTPLAYDLVLKRSNTSLRKYTIEMTMLDPEEVEHPIYCGCHMTKCILAKAVIEKYDHGDFSMN